MKITKVSLAALIALGAFSTASAVSLEEAVKDVEFKGFGRYRYTDTTKKLKKDGNEVKKDGASHAFRFMGNLKASYDDYFYGVLGFWYDATDGAKTQADVTNTTTPFKLRHYYLGFKASNTTIEAGKKPVGSLFDTQLVGTGVSVVSGEIPGVTIALVAYDALSKAGEATTSSAVLERLYSLKESGEEKIDLLKKEDISANLFGGAVFLNLDPVKAQLWLAAMPNTATLFGLDVTGSVDLSEEVALNAKVQFVNNSLSSDIKNLGYSNAQYYAAQLGTSLYGFNINAGYIGFNTKDDKPGFATIESNGQLIDPSKMIFDYNSGDDKGELAGFKGKNNFGFINATYKFAELTDVPARVFAGFIGGAQKLKNDNISKNEWHVGAGYAYSKQLDFSTFFAQENRKNDSKDKLTKNRFRVEAKYTF